jgi:hypothetical protein
VLFLKTAPFSKHENPIQARLGLKPSVGRKWRIGQGHRIQRKVATSGMERSTKQWRWWTIAGRLDVNEFATTKMGFINTAMPSFLMFLLRRFFWYVLVRDS